MKRNFRLRQSAEFERVRRFGKSYAHPLVVLIALKDAGIEIQIGISAGRSVGQAVQRNKAKRMLREAVRSLLPVVEHGWNMILIARSPILQADLTEIQTALSQLFSKANLIRSNNET